LRRWRLHGGPPVADVPGLPVIDPVSCPSAWACLRPWHDYFIAKDLVAASFFHALARSRQRSGPPRASSGVPRSTQISKVPCPLGPLALCQKLETAHVLREKFSLSASFAPNGQPEISCERSTGNGGARNRVRASSWFEIRFYSRSNPAARTFLRNSFCQCLWWIQARAPFQMSSG